MGIKKARRLAGRKMGESGLVCAIVADGFHGTTFHGLLTQGFFLFVLRLFIEKE